MAHHRAAVAALIFVVDGGAVGLAAAILCHTEVPLIGISQLDAIALSCQHLTGYQTTK
jgi:hypothetical protein